MIMGKRAEEKNNIHCGVSMQENLLTVNKEARKEN
jgi:hypothetical protein